MATQLATLFLRKLEVPVVLTDVDAERATTAVESIREELAGLGGEGPPLGGQGALPRLARDRGRGHGGLRRLRPRPRGRLRGARREAGGLRARSSDVVAPECLLVTNTSALSVTAMGEGLGASRARRRAALLQPGRRPAARRGRAHRRDRRRDARHRLGRDPQARQARRARRRRAGVRRQPDADAPVDRAHAGARERLDLRGDRRGRAQARDPDAALRAARDGRPARREPRARDAPRTRSPSASRSRRRCSTLADGEFPQLEQRDDRPSVDEIHVQILEALADEARHILDDGVVATAAEIDACLILGAGYPVLPRRDHEAPRPDRRLRARRRRAPLADALRRLARRSTVDHEATRVRRPRRTADARLRAG